MEHDERMAACWSCESLVNRGDNLCRGCGRVLCEDCNKNSGLGVRRHAPEDHLEPDEEE